MDDGAETDFATASGEALRSTPTGQVATSYPGSETIQTLNAALARKMYPRRMAAARPERVADIVRRRLGVAEPRRRAELRALGTVERSGHRVETLELVPEPGNLLPASLFVPADGPQRKPAITYLDPAGVSVAGAASGPIEALVREGNAVLAIDLRGYGRSAPRGRQVGGYSPEYSTTMRALLVGRNLPGMQTEDVLSAYEFLARRPDVVVDRIRLVGRGNGALPALFAALIEPRIARVTTDGGPESYLALSQVQTHRGLLDLVVPGVLVDFDLPDVRKALGGRLEVSSTESKSRISP